MLNDLLIQAQPLEIIQTLIGENHGFSLVGFSLDRLVYGTFVPFSSVSSSCANSRTSTRNSPFCNVTCSRLCLTQLSTCSTTISLLRFVLLRRFRYNLFNILVSVSYAFGSRFCIANSSDSFRVLGQRNQSLGLSIETI